MGRNSSGNRGGGSTQAPIDTRGIAAYNQVKQMKEKYPDAVMLVRDGDVYRVFGKDTEALSAIGIKTSKISDGKGTTINEAGFPHHSLESVLPKLVRQGKRIAIMDAPIEQPKLAKRGGGTGRNFSFSKSKAQDLNVAINDIGYAQYRHGELDKEIKAAREKKNYRQVEDLIREQNNITKNLIRPSRKILSDSGIKTTEDLKAFSTWAKRKYGISVRTK